MSILFINVAEEETILKEATKFKYSVNKLVTTKETGLECMSTVDNYVTCD